MKKVNVSYEFDYIEAFRDDFVSGGSVFYSKEKDEYYILATVQKNTRKSIARLLKLLFVVFKGYREWINEIT